MDCNILFNLFIKKKERRANSLKVMMAPLNINTTVNTTTSYQCNYIKIEYNVRGKQYMQKLNEITNTTQEKLKPGNPP
jgi:hypothetical protein